MVRQRRRRHLGREHRQDGRRPRRGRAPTAHKSAAEATQIHDHYLKGTIHCGQCGSRLIVSTAKNRHGNVYCYFVCSGRHSKRTDCTRQAMLIDDVEKLIEDYYTRVQIRSTSTKTTSYASRTTGPSRCSSTPRSTPTPSIEARTATRLEPLPTIPSARVRALCAGWS
ncbi:hypothetical protein DW322_10980 [Rhodococcus rhodnii]|uniref:Recombinase zinc beta ribbon domain-containing protein n=1 Tax=Rhodococcus rhodnii TaxID=38312 RepID=A0A6P2CI37_9NOCA|nr:hypothetical protein DW322_10980 [Rhodococcus rhodnii]